MEYLDILDEAGNKTGEVKPRAEVHRDGDRHKAIHVWIINSKKELLIQKRSSLKESYPNMWDISFAGHLSAGEGEIEAVIKEAKEELGITLAKEDVKPLFTVFQQSVLKNGTYLDNEFKDVFIIYSDLDVSTLVLQDEEVAEVRFIPFQELEKRIDKGDKTIVEHPEEYKLLFKFLHDKYDNSNK